MHPDKLNYYAQMQNEALLQVAFNFGKKCKTWGFDATENPHDAREEKTQFEAWYEGFCSVRTPVTKPSTAADIFHDAEGRN